MTVSLLPYLPTKEMLNHLEGGEQRKGKKNEEGELMASPCDLVGLGVRVPVCSRPTGPMGGGESRRALMGR